MNVTLSVAQWLVRITGVLLLILGLLIWTENAGGLIGIHTALGMLLVVALLVLAGGSSRAGVPPRLAIGVAVLALVALALGMTQAKLLPGSAHWVIQILHLLVGLAAVGSGEAIGGRLVRIRARA